MADTELQKAAQVEAQGQASAAPAKDTSKLLESFGGFRAVSGFMPDAENLNPMKKAAKAVFL